MCFAATISQKRLFIIYPAPPTTRSPRRPPHRVKRSFTLHFIFDDSCRSPGPARTSELILHATPILLLYCYSRCAHDKISPLSSTHTPRVRSRRCLDPVKPYGKATVTPQKNVCSYVCVPFAIAAYRYRADGIETTGARRTGGPRPYRVDYETTFFSLASADDNGQSACAFQ